MPKLKSATKVLEWAEHIKLVFEAVVFVAGLKVSKVILLSIAGIPVYWIDALSWAGGALLLGIVLIVWKVAEGRQKDSQPQIEVSPVPTQSPSRLKILSASWGPVKKTHPPGIDDIDVAKKLREMQHDGLVVRADNNVAEGHDPTPNWPKRLRVVYAFRNSAAVCVERAEGETLILPEDAYLKRLIADSKPEEALFSPLQLEAFRFAKDICHFLSQFEPIPPDLTHATLSTHENQLLHARIEWRQKLASAYQLRFAERERLLKLKFGEVGITADQSAESPNARGLELYIPRLASTMVLMAHRVDGLQFKQQ